MPSPTSRLADPVKPLLQSLRLAAPGVMICLMAAIAAQFISEHYGAPAMLMALLFGMALPFVSDPQSRTASGAGLAARSLLRLGVALLGARISVTMLMDLGFGTILLVAAGLVATILFGMGLARLLGRSASFGFLTAGAVAICGASAAMAIAAVIARPGRGKEDEDDLLFTVLGVTLLSTLAMILYPILAARLGFDATASGVFLGGTIHDVAQVVGAGFSISPEVGETATLVKLMRVAMLAPVVLVASLVMMRQSGDGPAPAGGRPPLLPGFVLGFIALAALNSLGLIPAALSDLAATLSRWLLLTAMVAVGMRTSIQRLLSLGPVAALVLIADTLFIAVFILAGLRWTGHF
ncbi:putative sulfate exporter family transporter [Cereibacter changlensis JA139]|uniref:Putative sulfate exporter family transporter n=2 Tax=Cereibacter changlensis TaxID=402884 RepID=A0A2T4JP73_9RHOB|nr:putative sulfate exporter family transporter [Cereibacter changlensis JA139]PZX51187.1 putative integral membrane protein (TIGR00698 family) [Cereibacter changlensis]